MTFWCTYVISSSTIVLLLMGMVGTLLVCCEHSRGISEKECSEDTSREFYLLQSLAQLLVGCSVVCGVQMVSFNNCGRRDDLLLSACWRLSLYYDDRQMVVKI